MANEEQRQELGKKWIAKKIRECASVDVQIEWKEYRVAVDTPEGRRDTERFSRGDIGDCYVYHNTEVRQRVEQKILNLLNRLGIAN